MSVVLIAGSRSMNAILCFGLFWVAIFLIGTERHLRRYPSSYPLLPISVVLLIGVFASTYYYYQEHMGSFLLTFGKDITLTGRTYLWGEMIEISKEHILIGAGYHGFWVLENPTLIQMYRTFVWLPQQSHCGYLDIFNEEGMIGIVLFLIMLCKLIKRIFSIQRNNVWTSFVVVILIWNILESTLFRIRSVMGTMFLLSYVVIYCYDDTRQVEHDYYN
jgi:O-antigen ligase